MLECNPFLVMRCSAALPCYGATARKECTSEIVLREHLAIRRMACHNRCMVTCTGAYPIACDPVEPEREEAPVSATSSEAIPEASQLY
jgi:hypothetical protein